MFLKMYKCLAIWFSARTSFGLCSDNGSPHLFIVNPSHILEHLQYQLEHPGRQPDVVFLYQTHDGKTKNPANILLLLLLLLLLLIIIIIIIIIILLWLLLLLKNNSPHIPGWPFLPLYAIIIMPALKWHKCSYAILCGLFWHILFQPA